MVVENSFRQMCHMSFPLVVFFSTVVYFLLIQETHQIVSIHRATGSHKKDYQSRQYEAFEDEAIFEDDGVQMEYVNSTINQQETTSNEKLIFALLSTSMVGFSGVLPIIILPYVKEKYAPKDSNGVYLNRLLSFAVGGLLGDVFLHLLPESWDHMEHTNSDGVHSHLPALYNGLWVLFGLISFSLLEKLMTDTEEKMENPEAEKLVQQSNNNTNNNNNKMMQNGSSKQRKNGIIKEKEKHEKKIEEIPPPQKVQISGYLNLFANCIDNFTHGLAIGGSYIVSIRVGILTTLAILLHEIPHEIGDFAILLRAGFDKKKAAKYQLSTSLGGFIGVLFAMFANSAQEAGNRVAWILPFTSGGFLYIALCTVLPDLLKEKCPKESLIQVVMICTAIGIMGLVGLIH